MNWCFHCCWRYIFPRSIRWSSLRGHQKLRLDFCPMFSKNFLNISTVGDLHIVKLQTCPFKLIIDTSQRFPCTPWPLTSLHTGFLLLPCANFLVVPRYFVNLPGREEVLDEPCGDDVEDELVLELDDSPGTTKRTKFSVLQRMFFPSWVNGNFPILWSDVALDCWHTHRFFRVLRKARPVIELQTCHRVIAPLRRDQDRKIIPVRPRSFALRQWPLPPLWGSRDFRRVSSSPELQSFLLSMCIDAPESIANSRSSGFFEQGASITQASARE